MSDYTLAVSWSGKDALSDSDSAKVISGADFNSEFTTIRTAVNSKADLDNSSQDFTCNDAEITGDATITGALAVSGVPTVPTQTAGNNTTRVATTAFVTTAVAAGGISEADQWRLTTGFTGDIDPFSANLERVDDASFNKLGTGMSHSSGTWAFPSTGIWMIHANWGAEITNVADPYLYFNATTNNGAAWDEILKMYAGNRDSGATKMNASGWSLLDVTDVSNVKLQFAIANGSSDVGTMGSSTTSWTYFTFIRLGDT